MPLPAGTGLDRRGFLARSLGLALSVYGATRLDLAALEEGIAHAATGSQPILVSVYMNGGVDSMSLLFPHGDPLYRKLRPTLAVRSGVDFTEDDRLRWHPAAQSLAVLHGEGKLAVMPAVGYRGADQSHFTSRHFWEVGATDPGARTGWLGRYLDRVARRTTRSRASRSTTSSRRRSRPPPRPWRRSATRTSTGSGAPVSGARSRPG